jgi:hypothetical protein
MPAPISNNIFIPVNVSKGMFSTEYTVKVTLANGNFVSFFADKSLIRKKGNNSSLRVILLREHKNTGTLEILLPVEAFETSTRWAEVKAA